MDEVSFGAKREVRLPLGRWRPPAAVAAVIAAVVVAAGIAAAVAAGGLRHAPVSQPPAKGSTTVSCPQVQPTWPNLEAVPASKRAAMLRVIIAAQLRCQSRAGSAPR